MSHDNKPSTVLPLPSKGIDLQELSRSSDRPYKVGTINLLILQVSKQRHREVNLLPKVT